MGDALDIDLSGDEGYDITIAGEPDLHIAWTQRFGDRAGVNRTSNYLEGALVATAMAAVNAIPVVCAARPGLRTFVDLPLITASGRVWPPAPLPRSRDPEGAFLEEPDQRPELR